MSAREIKKAAALYEAFREAAPAQRLLRRKILVPSISMHIGKVLAIEYTTTHGGKRVNYRHEFRADAAPELHSSPDGKAILIVGGSYTFTERGIVDSRKKRRR